MQASLQWIYSVCSSIEHSSPSQKRFLCLWQVESQLLHSVQADHPDISVSTKDIFVIIISERDTLQFIQNNIKFIAMHA